MVFIWEVIYLRRNIDECKLIVGMPFIALYVNDISVM